MGLELIFQLLVMFSFIYARITMDCIQAISIILRCRVCFDKPYEPFRFPRVFALSVNIVSCEAVVDKAVQAAPVCVIYLRISTCVKASD